LTGDLRGAVLEAAVDTLRGGSVSAAAADNLGGSILTTAAGNLRNPVHCELELDEKLCGGSGAPELANIALDGDGGAAEVVPFDQAVLKF